MLDLYLFALPGGTELILIILVIVLLFGASRIPKLMRGLGSGIKEFKQGVKEGESEVDASNKENNKLNKK